MAAAVTMKSDMLGVSVNAMRLGVSMVADSAGILFAQAMVTDISSRLLSDADLGWRLAMAAHELLDNARKYGLGGQASFEFAIVGDRPLTANMHVRSRANPDDIEHLREILAGIEAAADPWAFYLQAMQSAVAEEDRSGLGLARIRAEGDMVLRLAVDDEGYVRVFAEMQIAEGLL